MADIKKIVRETVKLRKDKYPNLARFADLHTVDKKEKVVKSDDGVSQKAPARKADKNEEDKIYESYEDLKKRYDALQDKMDKITDRGGNPKNSVDYARAKAIWKKMQSIKEGVGVGDQERQALDHAKKNGGKGTFKKGFGQDKVINKLVTKGLAKVTGEEEYTLTPKGLREDRKIASFVEYQDKITGDEVSISEETDLTEASIRSGTVKLNDGSSVKLSAKDARALNNLMDHLEAKNKKEMHNLMMSSADEFNAMVKFAMETA